MIKQQISLIVAMNQERVIGTDNQLPWHIPEDLAYFKQVTQGKPIIMGRKTFESIGRLLPGRKNIVISRSSFSFPGLFCYTSLEDALAANSDAPELCIIGGGQIFSQAINLATKLHLTIIDFPVAKPTAWFPELNYASWQEVSQNSFTSNNGVKCVIKVYTKEFINET